MMEKLKHCPFCGGKATIKEISYSGGYYVGCENPECYVVAVTRTENTQYEAIAAWNRREGGQENGFD